MAAHSPLVTLTFLGMAWSIWWQMLTDQMSTFEASKLWQDIWCYVWDTWSSNASCLTARHVGGTIIISFQRARWRVLCQRCRHSMFRPASFSWHWPPPCAYAPALPGALSASPLNQCHAKLKPFGKQTSWQKAKFFDWGLIFATVWN